jgi:hypothetical protein
VVGPQSITLAYDGTVPVLNAIPLGADLAHLFGNAGISGISRNAGSHAVAYSGGLSSDQLGYDIVAAQPATLTITPAALSLNAVTDTRGYDATTASAAIVNVTGLLGTDTVTGLTQSFDSANAGARTLGVNAGYTVNDGNGGGNYSVTFNAASGAITPAAATITYTANAATSTYGNAPGSFSGTVSAGGLFGADTLASVTSGTASYSTLASASSSVGSYAVTGSGLSGISANYTISFVQAPSNAAALMVVARPLTITADPASRLPSDPLSPLTYTLGGGGLVNGDVMSGALATTASASSPAGVYPITQGTLAASANYAVTYAGDNLTILPCTPANGCAVANVVEVATQVSNSLQQQERSGSTQTEQEKKEQAAAESTGNPKVVINSVIDTRNVSQLPPVDEPVSGSGNSTLWIPGDQ